jgi:hypothetical protein
MLYCVTSSICTYVLYTNPFIMLHYLKLFVMDMCFEFLKKNSANFFFCNFTWLLLLVKATKAFDHIKK